MDHRSTAVKIAPSSPQCTTCGRAMTLYLSVPRCGSSSGMEAFRCHDCSEALVRQIPDCVRDVMLAQVFVEQDHF